jgi:thiosulfate/3-mercaptopyruvate sulfurtransferase
MLLYVGASTVSLLDGGWSAWLAQGGKVQAEPDSVASGHFTVRFQPQRRQTFRTLRTWYRSGTIPVLIDTRSRAEFHGEHQDHLPRGGHLVGAHLLPFTDLFQHDGRYVGRETYLMMLPREARQATNLVAYCEVGVRASLFAMLHEAYTDQVVAVYDGSVTQWALARNLPMANALTAVSHVNERRST